MRAFFYCLTHSTANTVTGLPRGRIATRLKQNFILITPHMCASY